MSPLNPPCRKDCPRRRAQPNCHNREYCPAWGEFEDAEALRKEKLKRHVQSEKDANAAEKAAKARLAKRGGR